MSEHIDRPQCPISGCDRLCSPGWTICATHGLELGDWLRALPGLYEQLDANPNLPSPSAARDGRGGGSLKSMRNPALLDVIVLRDPRSKERSAYDPDGNRGRGVQEVIFARAAEVRAGRGLVVHEVPHTVPLGGRPIGPGICEGVWCDHAWCERWTLRMWVTPRPTLASEHQVLVDELDWVRGQDWAAEFHAELEALAELLDRGVVHVVIAGPRCRELIDGEQCTGHVHAVGQLQVRCDRCSNLTSGFDVLRRYSAAAVA